MHRLNTSYGNKAILASHCGLELDLPIWGHLQHGWQPLPYGAESFSTLGSRSIKFVWSNSLINRGEGNRKGKYISIGSPFSYLLQNNPSLWPILDEGTISFPFHSAPGEPIQNRHTIYAEELIVREGSPVVVCLYWTEYSDKIIRNSYESLGHKVVSVGTSRNNRFFLPSMLGLLQGYNRVVSNSMSSIMAFTAALGFETEIYGDGMASPGLQEKSQKEALRILIEDQNLSGTKISVGRDWAMKELGWDETLNPEELSAKLGWTGIKKFTGQNLLGTVQNIRTIIRK